MDWTAALVTMFGAVALFLERRSASQRRQQDQTLAQIHVLVNSRMTEALESIQGLTERVAILTHEVAARTGDESDREAAELAAQAAKAAAAAAPEGKP